MPAPLPATDRRQLALRFLGRELRVGLPLCLAVALFLSLVFRDPFGITLL